MNVFYAHAVIDLVVVAPGVSHWFDGWWDYEQEVVIYDGKNNIWKMCKIEVDFDMWQICFSSRCALQLPPWDAFVRWKPPKICYALSDQLSFLAFSSQRWRKDKEWPVPLWNIKYQPKEFYSPPPPCTNISSDFWTHPSQRLIFSFRPYSIATMPFGFEQPELYHPT